MNSVIDLSGYVLVPRERLRQLEEIEVRSKTSNLFEPNHADTFEWPRRTLESLETFKFSSADEIEWPRKPPKDAPEPAETAEYTVHFYNDMGHLGYHFTPEYTGKTDLLLAVLPYSEQDMRDVYKNIDGVCFTYLKLKPGRPMERNVSVKLDGKWVTVCLDYDSLDHHIEG